MSNLAYRHWHVCPDHQASWECYVPGGCREEREKTCSYCLDDKDDEDGEDEE